MVIIEALIVGVVGSVLGIAFGFLLALGIRALMNAVGLGIPQSALVLLPRTVVVGMAVGVLLTVASSLLPARKASRIPPIAALREDASRTPRRSLHRRAVIGTVVTGIGVAFLGTGLFLGVGNPLVLVAAGAAIGFIGVSVLAPLAARPLANVIGWPLPKLFGVSGQLAKENTKRQPRRTASTASALMVGVALVVFFSVFASSTKASVSETIFELFPADITFQSTNQTDPEVPAVISPGFADEIRTLEELEVVSAMQFGKVLVGEDEKLIGAVDPATIEQVFSLDAADGAVETLNRPNTVIVSTSYLEGNDLALGDTLTIGYLTTGAVDTQIGGVFEANDFSDLYISTDTYIANFRYEGDAVLFANAADGVSVADASEAVAPTAASYGNVKAQTKSEIVTEAETQIDQALLLFTGLLFFAVIIAVLGITNTLTLSVYERTREIGLLRAVGMSRRQVRRMVRWEAVIVATFGALLGVGIGIVLGWSVVKALSDEGLGAFSIPVGQVIGALVLAALAGVLAAIWPARKAARMNILEAISTE
jgi:putative ABC transport system permease protein